MFTEEYLQQYLDTFVVPFRKPNTAACYRRAFATLPRSVLGVPLDQLDGLTIQAALNAKARKHPRAAQLQFTCLSAALRKGVDLGMLPRSPLAGCVKPNHDAARATVFTADQLAVYLQCARSEGAYPLLLLMATCGLRRGEALGLQWRDVDLTSGVLCIHQQRMRVHHGYQLQPLKSRASVRQLPLSPIVAEELRGMRVRSFSGFVFDCTPESLRKAHLRAIARGALPRVTLHGLRHSMATLAASQGCPMKILQGILGHSRFELTANLYADHLTSDIYTPYLASVASSMLGRYQSV